MGGFPHSGTTILKNRMGDCLNCVELQDELPTNNHKELFKLNFDSIDKDFVVVKSAMVLEEYYRNPKRFNNYIIVFICRNPYFVFSGIHRRFINVRFINKFDTKGNAKFLPKHTDFRDYERFANLFLELREKPRSNTYCIKYEDLFKRDFKKLKALFNNIGLVHTPETFTGKFKDEYRVTSGVGIKESSEDPENNFKFRTWQINQGFRNMNLTEKLGMPREWYETIKNSSVVSKLGYKTVIDSSALS